MLKEKIVSKLKSQKVKNFIIYGFGQIVNLLTPLLITPYLIFKCGIENLGAIAMGQAFAFILIVIVDYSSYITGVKEISINRQQPKTLEKLFKTIYAVKFLLLLSVCALTCIIVYFIPYFDKNSMVFYYSLSIVVGQFINPTWFFQGVENFLWISIINVLAKIINVFGVVFFITSAEDFIYANLWAGIGAILANLLGFFWIMRRYKIELNNISLTEVKKILKDDFSFCISQLFFAIRNYSPVMIIGFFAGEYLAGQFKIIEQIITLLRTYLQLFFKFSYSYVCFEIDKNLRKGILLWKKLNGTNGLFFILILVLFYVFSDFILLFFKVDNHLLSEFKIYLHLALIIPIFIGVTLPLEQLLFSLNKNKQYIKITILSTIFNFIGLSLIVNYLGLKEVIIFLIITEVTIAFIYLLILKPYFSQQAIVNE